MANDWLEVRECHRLSGETDFLPKIVVSDRDALHRFLTARLTLASNVSTLKPVLASRARKQQSGVPTENTVGPAGIRPDRAANAAARRSGNRDAQHLVDPDAARRAHLAAFTDPFTYECPGDRRSGRDRAPRDIGLIGPDD